MHKPLRLLALLALLSACGGDDDGSDGKTTADAGDAGSNPTPPRNDASAATDARVTSFDAYVPPTNQNDATIAPIDNDSGATTDPDTGVVVPPQPNADQVLSANLEAKFKTTCNAFNAGNWSSDFFAVRDTYERCVATCVVNAECPVFLSSFCNKTGTLENTSLFDCIGTCDIAPADGYSCSNGAKITHAQVCNAEVNCPDGADEANCPNPFTCANGKVIPSRLVCDAVPQCCKQTPCDDVSDEPPTCARCL